MKKSDKVHIIGCAVLLPLFTILFNSISKGALTTVGVFLMKEIIDELAKRFSWLRKITCKIGIYGTGFSIRDIIYDVIGCVAGSVIMIIYVLVRIIIKG